MKYIPAILLLLLSACVRDKTTVTTPEITYSTYSISTGVKDLLNAIVQENAPLDFTSEKFLIDTLQSFSDSSLLINVRYLEGCQSAGFCNQLLRDSFSTVYQLNYIKGYIDSVFFANGVSHLLIRIPADDTPFKQYNVYYTDSGYIAEDYTLND